MNTQYLPSGQTAQYGDLKPAVLLGTNGPTAYSQVTRDPVANPGAGDYIEFPMSAETLSKTYRVEFYPLAATLREGAPSASQSGWVARWFVVSTGAEVATGSTNLSAEQVVFGAFISQL
jgi:hypothetical protein